MLDEFLERIVPEVTKLEKLMSYDIPFDPYVEKQNPELCDHLNVEFIQDSMGDPAVPQGIQIINGLYCHDCSTWVKEEEPDFEDFDRDR